jgi:hypothetical protein
MHGVRGIHGVHLMRGVLRGERINGLVGMHGVFGIHGVRQMRGVLQVKE